MDETPEEIELRRKKGRDHYYAHHDEILKWRREHHKKHPEQKREADRRYRETHSETVKKRKKEYYDERREEKRKSDREYYWKNREKVLATVTKYRRSHKEAIQSLNKNYKEANKAFLLEQHNEYIKTPDGHASKVRSEHKRRSRSKDVENTLTAKQWALILKLQNNKCADCGEVFTQDVKPTRDHIIPLSLGGGLTFGNVQALCQSCNSKKCNRVEFMKAIAEVIEVT